MKFKDLIRLVLFLILVTVLCGAALLISHWDEHPYKYPFYQSNQKLNIEDSKQ